MVALPVLSRFVAEWNVLQRSRLLRQECFTEFELIVHRQLRRLCHPTHHGKSRYWRIERKSHLLSERLSEQCGLRHRLLLLHRCCSRRLTLIGQQLLQLHLLELLHRCVRRGVAQMRLHADRLEVEARLLLSQLLLLLLHD